MRILFRPAVAVAVLVSAFASLPFVSAQGVIKRDDAACKRLVARRSALEQELASLKSSALTEEQKTAARAHIDSQLSTVWLQEGASGCVPDAAERVKKGLLEMKPTPVTVPDPPSAPPPPEPPRAKLPWEASWTHDYAGALVLSLFTGDQKAQRIQINSAGTGDAPKVRLSCGPASNLVTGTLSWNGNRGGFLEPKAPWETPVEGCESGGAIHVRFIDLTGGGATIKVPCRLDAKLIDDDFLQGTITFLRVAEGPNESMIYVDDRQVEFRSRRKR